MTARGRRLGPFIRSWTPTEAVVYALGVGAGPDALEYTTEDETGAGQQVLPTFAAVLGRNPPAVWEVVGLTSLAGVLHGAHAVTIHRPLPPEGTITLNFEISEIWDKGETGVFVVSAEAVDSGSGQRLFTSRFTGLARGEGGFGGDRGPSLRHPEPAGPPDVVMAQTTMPQQALLYRLCGDRNPLHSDPVAAARAGFERPILHGLCTYGFVGRALLGTLCGRRAAAPFSFEARFLRPVFPGEVLFTEAWTGSRPADGARTATFRTSTGAGAVLAGSVTVGGGSAP